MCHCDHDEPRIFNTRRRVARKPHYCCECARTIEVGETYQYIEGVWDKGWDTYHVCLQCQAVADGLNARIDCYCRLFGGLWNDVDSYEFDVPWLWYARASYGITNQWRFRGKMFSFRDSRVPAPT